MIKRELNSVSYLDKLSSVSQLFKYDLNHLVEMFYSALKETANVMTTTIRCGPYQEKQKNKVSLFDHECRAQKRKTRKALRSFKKRRTAENETSCIEEKRNYRKLMKDKKDHNERSGPEWYISTIERA